MTAPNHPFLAKAVGTAWKFMNIVKGGKHITRQFIVYNPIFKIPIYIKI